MATSVRMVSWLDRSGVGISYGVDGPLLPHGVEPADHTHAFDNYCNPFSQGAPDFVGLDVRLIRTQSNLKRLSLVSLL